MNVLSFQRRNRTNGFNSNKQHNSGIGGYFSHGMYYLDKKKIYLYIFIQDITKYYLKNDPFRVLTHWSPVTLIYVSQLAISGKDNWMSPRRRQAIFWTNAGISLNRTKGSNFSEISSEIQTFLFKRMQVKISSAIWWYFFGLNVLPSYMSWGFIIVNIPHEGHMHFISTVFIHPHCYLGPDSI